jgi:hypothetical protein
VQVFKPRQYPAACISASSLVWTESAVTAVCRSSDGSSGVIFALNKGAVVVLKSNSSLAQELFGTRLGQALGVTVPDMRCVGWTQKEHDLIHRAVMHRTPGPSVRPSALLCVLCDGMDVMR